MKSILTTIILFLAMSATAQKVRVDTLLLPTGERMAAMRSGQLRFPLINTGDSKIDGVINKDLIDRFTNNEYPDLPADSTLIRWAGDQIAYLDFEITHVSNGLISLNITAEGCGAYCTGWTEYFTYSTTTGKHVPIQEIVDTAGRFKAMVLADKDQQYDEQRLALKTFLTDPKTGLDKDIYSRALEYYDNCDSSFALKSFALHPDHLEVVSTCYLPNAIKDLTPEIRLRYRYDEIGAYLRLALK